MSMTLLFAWIFSLVPVLNGYGIELYLVVYIFGLITITDKKWAWFFCLVTPWFLLIKGFTVINFWDLLLEYILNNYIFWIFIYFFNFFDWLEIKKNKKNTVLMYFSFIFLSVILFSIKLACSVIAGYLWWFPGQWLASFLFNMIIIWGSLAICLPFLVLSLKPMRAMYQDQINRFNYSASISLT